MTLAALLLCFAIPGGALRRLHVKDAARSTEPAAKVLTLGDSYASGVGIHTSPDAYSGGDCYKAADHRLPGGRYAAAHGMEFINFACAGSEIWNVNKAIDTLENMRAPDFAAKWEGSVITLSVGGNNFKSKAGEGWGEMMLRCVLFTQRCNRQSMNQPGNLDNIDAGLHQLYGRLARDASKARIRISGYPYLMRPKNSFVCTAFPILPVSEAKWMDETVDQLNGRIRRAVADTRSAHPNVDIQYVHVKNYTYNCACARNRNEYPKEINALVLDGLKPSVASLHPTQAGYDKFYQALKESL